MASSDRSCRAAAASRIRVSIRCSSSQKKAGSRITRPGLFCGVRLVHPAHTAAARRSGSRLIFLLLDDDRFCRQEESGDRRRVLERRARHLSGVDDARLNEVLVRVREGVVAEGIILRATYLLDHERAFSAGVLHDHADRLLERAADDLDADLLVGIGQLYALECTLRAK